MLTAITNVHPSFIRTAQRRGYLNAGHADDDEAKFAELERKVAVLEAQIADFSPEVLTATLRDALAPVAGEIALEERKQTDARLHAAWQSSAEEFKDYDLNAMMEGD